MIMNPEMTAFKTMFDYDLEPEVYSFRLLDALVKAARREGITGYPVHIKLDTGMHRLGFNPKTDIDELILRLQSQNAIIPVQCSRISWVPTVTTSTISQRCSSTSSMRRAASFRQRFPTRSCAISATLPASNTSQSASSTCVVSVSDYMASTVATTIY